MERRPPGQAAIGAVIGGRYRIVGLLGRGGMGTVYRGVQLGIDRPVAIKIISREVADDRVALQRFQREAKLTSRLTHPNSIRVFDFGVTAEDRPYLVMELLQGRELAAELAEHGRLPPARAIAIAEQVLRALREAHGMGILHRDLKPENLFLRDVIGEEDLVKVVDFGIAKSVEGDVSRVTQSGSLVGTPAYMSPEQSRGDELDGRSDLYAVGTILWEMLAGRLPFPPQGDSPVSILIARLTTPLPSLAAVAPDVPGVHHLEAALAALLADDPADRPADADAALALLADVRKRLPAHGATAWPDPADEIETVIGPVPTAPAPASATGPTPGAPRRLPILLAGIGLLAMVAAGALFAFTRTAPGQAPPDPRPPSPVDSGPAEAPDAPSRRRASAAARPPSPRSR